MANRILIVEDEPRLREVLCDYFTAKGDSPCGAADGREALDAFALGDYDAVLLDVLMPGLDGFSVCRELRRQSSAPVIFLTALSEEEDKLKGYELGADDYVTKPFSLSVLYAKTCALIRRAHGELTVGERYVSGALCFDLNLRTVSLRGNVVALKPKEYDLLLCLARNKGFTLSREQLIMKCWSYDFDGDIRTVDTHIKRIRQALGREGKAIRTVVKIGYRFEGVEQ